MGEPLVFLAPVARKKGAGPKQELAPKNATSPLGGGSLDEGRSSVRVQPNRKGGFYLHRDGSPLGEWIPGNFHCDISAVIEQAPTPDTSPALISGRPARGNLGGPLVCLGFFRRDVDRRLLAQTRPGRLSKHPQS